MKVTEHMTDGTFIVLEGLDGSGKSTICEYLHGLPHPITLTCEPYSYEIDPRASNLQHAISFTEDRIKHVEAVIEPALERGEIVVCDRYWPSTVAYECANDISLANTIISMSRDRFPTPDAYIYPRVSTETAVRRSDGLDVFETSAYLEDAKGVYEQFSGLTHWHTIDAEQPERDMCADAERVFLEQI